MCRAFAWRTGSRADSSNRRACVRQDCPPLIPVQQYPQRPQHLGIIDKDRKVTVNYRVRMRW